MADAGLFPVVTAPVASWGALRQWARARLLAAVPGSVVKKNAASLCRLLDVQYDMSRANTALGEQLWESCLRLAALVEGGK